MSEVVIRGGHRTVDTGKVDKGMPTGDQTLYRCLDCETVTTRIGFGGIRGANDGCPARPESLDFLSVCPGGERCEGHMDTSTAQWRAWKDSPDASSDGVPRFHHTVDDLAERAAAQYLRHADLVEMKMGVWAAQGRKVGAEGGTVAEFQHSNGKQYEVHVDQYGKITAVQKEK